MQSGKMHPDWMQWIPCSVVECSGFHAGWRNGTLLNAVDFMQHDWMQWIPCSMIACSGFYAPWPKASRLIAVDSMQRHWIQRIPCIVAQWIPIVCSGVHAVRPNASQLNAVDYMQHGPKHPDWVSGFHAVWCNWFSLNALIPCIKAQCFLIECTRFHAAF